MADEKKHTRKHIVHKHTTKGFNERHEIEDILREKLEVGEIALNVGKDRPSLVFFAEHTPVSPHDADTNFDKMIELRPSPYVIHSASTDNVKPEIKEDHSLFDPYYIENFVTKLSDDYVEPESAVTLGPGTTLDEAIGQLVLSDKNLSGRINEISGMTFATIDNQPVNSDITFKSRTLNGEKALEYDEREYSHEDDGCSEMVIGKIDGHDILTKGTPTNPAVANNFKFAKINGSAVTYVNEDAVDINVPMTRVSAGHGIKITTSQDGIDNEIAFSGLSLNNIDNGKYVKNIRVNQNDNTKLDVTYADEFYTKEEVDGIVSGVTSEFRETINNFSGDVVSAFTEIKDIIEEDEYITAQALNDLNDRLLVVSGDVTTLSGNVFNSFSEVNTTINNFSGAVETKLNDYQLLSEKSSAITTNPDSNEYPTSQAVIDYVQNVVSGAVDGLVDLAFSGDGVVVSGSVVDNKITLDKTRAVKVNSATTSESADTAALLNWTSTDTPTTVNTYRNVWFSYASSNGVQNDKLVEDEDFQYNPIKNLLKVSGLSDGTTEVMVPHQSGTIALISDIEQALASGVNYKGATSAIPTGTPKNGDLWICSEQFTVDGKPAEVGDFIIYNGSSWDVIEKNNDGAVTAAADLDADYIVLGNGDRTVKKSNLTLDDLASKSHTVRVTAVLSGGGNAITSISASDNDSDGTHVIVYGMGTKFAESAHTHISEDIIDAVSVYDSNDADKLLKAESISGAVFADSVLTQNTLVIPAETNSRKVKSANVNASATTLTPGSNSDAHVAILGNNVVFGFDIPRGDKGERGYSITGLTAPASIASGSSQSNTYTAVTEDTNNAGTFTVYNGAKGEDAERISGLTLYNQADVNTGSSEVNQFKLWGEDGSDYGIITVFSGAKGEKGDNGKAITIKPDMNSCTVINEHGFVYTGATQPGGFEQYHLYVLTGTGATSQTEFDDFSDVGLFAINGVGISAITATNNSGSSEANTVTVTLTDGRTQLFTVYNGAQGQQGIQGIQGIQGVQGVQGYSITGITAPASPNTGSSQSNTYTAVTQDGNAGTFVVWNGAQGEQGYSISSVTRVNATLNTGSSQSNEYSVVLNDGNHTQVGTFTVYNGAQGQQGIQGEPGKTLTIKPSETDCTEPDAHAFVYTGTTTAEFTHNHLYLLTEIDAQQNRHFDDLGEFAIEGRGIASVTSAATSDANRTGVEVTITLTDNTSSAFTVWNGTDAFTTDTMVKDANYTGKTYLLGHRTQGSTESADTNVKVYMSGGTIFIDGNEVLVSGYTYNKTEIDNIVSGINVTIEEDEYVTAQALNDLNDRLLVVSGDVNTINTTINNFSGNVVTELDKYQLLSERSTAVTSSSTDNEYPTSKAVYDYVDTVIGGYSPTDVNVKTATASTKAYLVAKTNTADANSGITNSKVFMSGGTIYLDGKEVATKEYVDNAPDSDENVAHKSNTAATAYILGVSTTGASKTVTSGITSGVYMLENGLYASHGFYQSSDERLKDFGEDVKVDFDELANVPKKYFTWKEKADSKQHIGTSAQELQKVYPELVKTDATGKLSVDYASLSVIALAAVDKLHKENEELKKRIESIERYLTEKNK